MWPVSLYFSVPVFKSQTFRLKSLDEVTKKSPIFDHLQSVIQSAWQSWRTCLGCGPSGLKLTSTTSQILTDLSLLPVASLVPRLLKEQLDTGAVWPLRTQSWEAVTFLKCTPFHVQLSYNEWEHYQFSPLYNDISVLCKLNNIVVTIWWVANIKYTSRGSLKLFIGHR